MSEQAYANAVYGTLLHTLTDDDSIVQHIEEVFTDDNNHYGDTIFGTTDIGQELLLSLGLEDYNNIHFYLIDSLSETDGASEPGDIIVGYGLGTFPDLSFDPPPCLKDSEWYTWVFYG